MLRALLADRFQMTMHRETKEFPVYVPGVAKGGPKIQPSKAEAPVAENAGEKPTMWSSTSLPRTTCR